MGACGSRALTSGFTLVELVLVLILLGILAAVALPRFSGLVGDTDRAQAQATAQALSQASSQNYARFRRGAEKAAEPSGAISDNEYVDTSEDPCDGEVIDTLMATYTGRERSDFDVAPRGEDHVGEFSFTVLRTQPGPREWAECALEP